MKNLLITNKNIFYIYGVLKKILQGKQIKIKHYYNDCKRLQHTCNKIGFNHLNIITESNTNKFKVVESYTNIVSGEYYINFNNAVEEDFPTEMHWLSHVGPYFKATVIDVGMKITIKNNIIYLSYIEEPTKLYGFKTPRKIIKKITVIPN